MTNKEWALKMIPVLIHWAQYSWETPHYYSELSNAIGHKTNQIGSPLGCVHDIIDELATKYHRIIPTLNSLVISKSSKLPSNGFSYVIANYDNITEDEQVSQAAQLRRLAHQYDWDWVLKALNLERYNPPVSYWILPSNSAKFHIHDYLANHDIVDWKQYNNFAEGDILFMYSTAPESKVRYMFRAIRTDVPSSEHINDRDYWTDESEHEAGLKHNRHVRLKLIAQLSEDDVRLSLDALKSLGVKTVQGASQIKEQTSIDYILSIFKKADDFDSDLLDTTGESFFEGVKRQVTVNSYERDHKARLQCIKIHGTACAVCGIDFEKMYGELGKGFIHVHHIVPIHTIGQGYKVDPTTDLVPVCPNCHAMLHRGMNGEARSIEELKNLIKKDIL